MKQVTVYTDGACSGNPGPGGWGAILRCTASHRRELSGGEAATTNNRMELTAVIRGPVPAEGALQRGPLFRLQIRHRRPGEGLGPGLEEARGWVKSDKKPALNPDLWEQLLALTGPAPAALPLGQRATRRTPTTTAVTSWPWRKAGSLRRNRWRQPSARGLSLPA